jgi:hypothetical protein
MPDDEAERLPAAYPAHLAALGPTLPDGARRLATEVSLHDELLGGVERRNGRLELLFRAGDPQGGYFDALLQYDGVGIADADALFVQSTVGRRDIELLYDEFDSHEGGWSHTLLFWPYHEVPERRRQAAYCTVEVNLAQITVRYCAY